MKVRRGTSDIDKAINLMNLVQTRGGQMIGAVENKSTGTIHAIINPDARDFVTGMCVGVRLQCHNIIGYLEEFKSDVGLSPHISSRLVGSKYTITRDTTDINCKSCLKRKISLNNGKMSTINKELQIISQFGEPEAKGDLLLMIHDDVETHAKTAHELLEYLEEQGYSPLEIVENFEDGTFQLHEMRRVKVNVKHEIKIDGLEVTW